MTRGRFFGFCVLAAVFCVALTVNCFAQLSATAFDQNSKPVFTSGPLAGQEDVLPQPPPPQASWFQWIPGWAWVVIIVIAAVTVTLVRRRGTPVIAFLAVLLGSYQPLHADSTNASVKFFETYPKAFVPGNSYTVTLKGDGFDGLTGCDVGLAGTGCNVERVISGQEALLKVTLAPNSKTGTKPMLRLKFGNTFRDFANFFAVETSTQFAAGETSFYMQPPYPQTPPVQQIAQAAPAAQAPARRSAPAPAPANNSRQPASATSAPLTEEGLVRALNQFFNGQQGGQQVQGQRAQNQSGQSNGGGSVTQEMADRIAKLEKNTGDLAGVVKQLDGNVKVVVNDLNTTKQRLQANVNLTQYHVGLDISKGEYSDKGGQDSQVCNLYKRMLANGPVKIAENDKKMKKLPEKCGVNVSPDGP